MLVYLIASLPKLYIGKHPTISKEQFIHRVYQCFSTEQLFDFSLLIKMDKHLNFYKNNLKMNTSQSQSFLRKSLMYIMKNSNSTFLYTWAKCSMSIEEAIVGLTCKKEILSHSNAIKHFSDPLNPTSRTILKYYNLHDLGLSKRFSWFETIKSVIELNDLEQIEKTIDLIRFQLIDSIKTNEIFHMDFILAYYLELSILERQMSLNRSFGKKILQNILDSIVIGDLK